MIRVRGVGRVYWGVERYLSDTSIWSRAWLVQDMPPFRRSTHGWRIRIGSDRALHLGLCTFGDDPHRKLEFQPQEIGRWGAQAQEAAEGAGAGDEVRSLADGRRLHSVGDSGGRDDPPPG